MIKGPVGAPDVKIAGSASTASASVRRLILDRPMVWNASSSNGLIQGRLNLLQHGDDCTVEILCG